MHELEPGEYADSPRYTEALRASRTCFRCRVKAVYAVILWRIDMLAWWGVFSGGWFCPHCGSEHPRLYYDTEREADGVIRARCVGCENCLPKPKDVSCPRCGKRGFALLYDKGANVGCTACRAEEQLATP